MEKGFLMMLPFNKLARCTLAAAALACAAALPAHAHHVWVLPSTTVLSKPDWITVDAAVSNDLFYFNHVPLGYEGVVVTAPDGSAVDIQNPHRGKFRSVFDVQLKEPGTYRVAIANNGLIATFKDAAGQPKRWRGTVDKIGEIPADVTDLKITQTAGRIESFVTVGKPTQFQPTGQGLELVAVSHPNDLVKDEEATFIFHADGKPAADLNVLIIEGNSRFRDTPGQMKLKTDAQGRVTVKWPGAGRYWLGASLSDKNTNVEKASERRLTYSVTLEVLN